MCKMRSEDQYGLKWVVIWHLPKGIVYRGGINTINRTKPPKTKSIRGPLHHKQMASLYHSHDNSRVHMDVCKIKPNMMLADFSYQS